MIPARQSLKEMSFSVAVILYSSLSLSTAIYRGELAGEGEFPFSVAILQKGDVKCGGSLLTLRYVFTACQCVGNFDFEEKNNTETTTKTMAPRSKTLNNDTAINETSTTLVTTTVNTTTVNTTTVNTTTVTTTVATTVATTIPTTSATTTEMAATGSGANLDTQESIKSFKSIPLDQVKLVAATTWIYEFGHGQGRKPDQSYPHPDCNGTITPWLDDFGLYRASHSFLFTFTVGLMSVQNNDREELSSRLDYLVESGRVCETVGWGTAEIMLNDTIIKSEKLRKASVRLISRQVCTHLLCQPPYSYCNDSIFKENRFICGISTGNGESCSGDEGNPLICDGYIFGLLVWSPGCGNYAPKIFSSLHYGLDFYNAVSEGTPMLYHVFVFLVVLLYTSYITVFELYLIHRQ